jgi:Uma2 family endonuclease
MIVAIPRQIGDAIPIHQIELTPGSAICIGGLDWDEYITLLGQLGEDRSTRIAYSQKTIEIRMPGQIHEVINRLLAAIIMTLAEEYGYEFNGLGSMTINRPNLEKAIEPDSCFYIQNAQSGQGWEQAITNLDLPPDLAVEVDIAHRSDSKFGIYEAIGVPEIWVYQQHKRNLTAEGSIKFKQLVGDTYQEVSVSQIFPAVTTAQISGWIEMRRTATDLMVIRAVRNFCRSQKDL